MKGIVNTFLNERVKEPSVNAANPVYYEPGDVVEIVDILNGQEYDGNKVWYQLDNGAYVWSGGVQGTYEIDQEIQDQGRHSEVFNTVPGTGKGIGIAILDSGINVNHVHLSKRVKLYESYLEGKVKDNITDSSVT